MRCCRSEIERVVGRPDRDPARRPLKRNIARLAARALRASLLSGHDVRLVREGRGGRTGGYVARSAGCRRRSIPSRGVCGGDVKSSRRTDLEEDALQEQPRLRAEVQQAHTGSVAEPQGQRRKDDHRDTSIDD